MQNSIPSCVNMCLGPTTDISFLEQPPKNTYASRLEVLRDPRLWL